MSAIAEGEDYAPAGRASGGEKLAEWEISAWEGAGDAKTKDLGTRPPCREQKNRRPVKRHEAGDKNRGLDESASDIAQGTTALNDNDLLTLTRLSFARFRP